MDKYNIQKKFKECCENVDVELVSLNKCHYFSGGVLRPFLPQTEYLDGIYDEICTVQSNVTYKTPLGGKVKRMIDPEVARIQITKTAAHRLLVFVIL